MPAPLAYFLTIGTYGTWLHGSHHASVDWDNRQVGAEFVTPNPDRVRHARSLMAGEPVLLCQTMRMVVQSTLVEVASHRGWTLHACHVRTTHWHAVVSAEAKAEKVLINLKAYATRRIREQRLIARNHAVWAEHGSTRYLWDEQSVGAAIRYVVDGQGKSMEPAPYCRTGL